MARPNLSYLKNLFLVVFGLPCGILTGLTGLSSSLLVAPGVRYLLGSRPARAAGTALAATLCAALASLVAYAQHHAIWGRLAIVLALGQIMGAGWGVRLVEARPGLTRPTFLWALLVIGGGVAMMAQGAGLLGAHSPGVALHGAFFWVSAFVVGAGVSILGRVLELAGVLLVPALIYLLGLSPLMAQGCSLLVLILASLPAVLIYGRRGDLEPQSAVWVSFGGAFGALWGAMQAVTIATMQSPRLLVEAYGMALTALGLMMLWRKERPVPAS